MADSRHDWLDALGLIAKPDKIPPGWLTSKQIVKTTGRGLTAVLRALKAGNVERRKFRIITKRGPAMVPYYRLKQKGAKE